METDNVILFPKNKSGVPPQTVDDIIHNVDNVRRGFVEGFVKNQGEEIIRKLAAQGIDVSTNPKTYVEFMFALEVLKCVLYRKLGLEHPLSTEFDSKQGDEGEQP